MPSLGLSFKFQTHITIQRPQTSLLISSPPFHSLTKSCLLTPFYTPSCPSQEQSHCPLPVLSDPMNPHHQSLLLQEFWNLFSLSCTSTLVQALAISLPSNCSRLLAGLPVNNQPLPCSYHCDFSPM